MSSKIYIQYTCDTSFIGEGGTQVSMISYIPYMTSEDLNNALQSISDTVPVTVPDTVPDTPEDEYVVITDTIFTNLEEAEKKCTELSEKVIMLIKKVEDIKSGIVESPLEKIADLYSTDYMIESQHITPEMKKAHKQRKRILKEVCPEMVKLFNQINESINQIIDLKEITLAERKKIPSRIKRGIFRTLTNLVGRYLPPSIIPTEEVKTYDILKQHLDLIFHFHMLKMILFGSINLQRYALESEDRLQKELLTNLKNQLGADNLSQDIIKMFNLQNVPLLRFTLRTSIEIISKYFLNITQITEDQKKDLEQHIREKTDELNKMKHEFEIQLDERAVVEQVDPGPGKEKED
jgi:hypothetical protein